MNDQNLIENNKKVTIYFDETEHFFSVYLTGKIGRPYHYTKLFHVLNSGHLIKIYLNSSGGYTDSGWQIVRQIRRRKANTTIIVQGECTSMASHIALAGTSLQMETGTYLYFHNFSIAYLEVEQTAFWQNIQGSSPFLSANELTGLMNDQEIYIHNEDITLESRIERHFEYWKLT